MVYGGLTLPDYTTALDGASCSNIGVNTKMLGWLTKRTIMNSAEIFGKTLQMRSLNLGMLIISVDAAF